MLVKFRSEAGNITMFGDVAVTLLKMMGQSGVLPGALVAKDVPAALERLKRAAAVAPEPSTRGKESAADDRELPCHPLRCDCPPSIRPT